MSRPRPPQELIDKWAAMYNHGHTLREIQRGAGVSYGTIQRYVSRHPTVTMRSVASRPSVTHPWNQ